MYHTSTSSMQDLVSKILICCTFELGGGEHEKL